jgi:hypothetical protein
MTEKSLGQVYLESLERQACVPSSWHETTDVMREWIDEAAHEVVSVHEARKWQPIDKAPRDGSGFIGLSPTHGIVWNVSWNHAFARFDKNGHDSLMSDYVLWQNMPKPPKEL